MAWCCQLQAAAALADVTAWALTVDSDRSSCRAASAVRHSVAEGVCVAGTGHRECEEPSKHVIELSGGGCHCCSQRGAAAGDGDGEGFTKWLDIVVPDVRQ